VDGLVELAAVGALEQLDREIDLALGDPAYALGHRFVRLQAVAAPAARLRSL